jgi:hypothetical protein
VIRRLDKLADSTSFKGVMTVTHCDVSARNRTRSVLSPQPKVHYQKYISGAAGLQTLNMTFCDLSVLAHHPQNALTAA